MDLMAWTAVGIALVAAFRSTWSPCGVSMLSSITPLSEAGRGHRYWATVSWFVAGSLLGGLTLGSVAALGAVAVGSLGLSATASAGLVLLAGVITLASDLKVGGFHLPANPRQVERSWLDRYRSWVYGMGFGWQLGVGVATYVMSASVYLMVVVAAATGEPLLALAIVTMFGLLRGLAVLPAAWVRSPADLGELHRRIERFRPASRVVAVVGQIAVLAVATTVTGGPVAGLITAVLLAVVASAFRSGIGDPAPRVRIPDTPAELDEPHYSG
ncbi:MAG TPA: hypothetical protein VFP67_12550 [Acidimicrobiia bacterium]|nr:hypothetical protein [Acidimicrobiia bacterium]